ncbi:MAG: 3-isopropylmalate dehydratase small subunit [Bosea sp.]|jgi:3-isopropylmalate/(R)-2-methylmalate dehydratase small subunit|nr:3-isopropylmalate dehydratase small subunit [Bosea sp. (in: a-proteobacteria)]
MERFTRLSAKACPLGLANVDTDQLIPARFMKRSRADGYGQFLLHDLRFAPDGAPVQGLPLSDPRYADARIIVAQRNFGTGSSREAAVYALWDYGVRCVIAPSFGDIFASNAVKNGLLPAIMAEADVETLLARLTVEPSLAEVDLEAQTVRCGDLNLGFAIDPVRRLQLLNGWDDLDLTLRHVEDIARYRARRLADEPWAMPGG